MDWKAECGQLNLAHVTKHKNICQKRELKTNKRQCPLSPVRVQDLWKQSEWNQKDYIGKDLWNRWVLSLEWWWERTWWVTVMRWDAQDEVNQEESEQDEVDGTKKGADYTGEVMHMWKSGWWFVMRKTRMVKLGQQRTRGVIRVDWTQIRFCHDDDVEAWLRASRLIATDCRSQSNRES